MFKRLLDECVHWGSHEAFRKMLTMTKPDKFDCNGHVSIMAVVRFGGETAIWGTYDGGAQSSELSGT